MYILSIFISILVQFLGSIASPGAYYTLEGSTIFSIELKMNIIFKERNYI